MLFFHLMDELHQRVADNVRYLASDQGISLREMSQRVAKVLGVDVGDLILAGPPDSE